MMALISEQDLAEQLKLDPDTLRRWRNEGGGPAFVRLGRVIRYDENTVATWLQREHSTKDEAVTAAEDDRPHVHLVDEATADIFEIGSIPLVRVTYRLLPYRPAAGEPWVTAVELEVGDPPPAGLAPASIFDTHSRHAAGALRRGSALVGRDA